MTKIEQRKLKRQTVLKESNQRTREKIVEHFLAKLFYLEKYAQDNQIPSETKWQNKMPLDMTRESFEKDLTFRDFVIRRYIQTSNDTVREIFKDPQYRFKPFFLRRIQEQEVALNRLIALLQ